MGRFLNRKHQLIGRGCNVLARLLVLTTIWLIRHIATHCYTKILFLEHALGSQHVGGPTSSPRWNEVLREYARYPERWTSQMVEPYWDKHVVRLNDK